MRLYNNQLSPSNRRENGKLNTRVDTLRPRQNGRHFPDDISKCIFFNENVWISFKISRKFVPKGPINNTPAFVQIMAWRRPGDKPLSEPMMVGLLTHICVTRPRVWQKKNPRLFSDISLTGNASSSHCRDIYPEVNFFCNIIKTT